MCSKIHQDFTERMMCPDCIQVDMNRKDKKIKELKSAMKQLMDWIGPPPTGKEYFDSLREDGWKAAKKAMEE